MPLDIPLYNHVCNPTVSYPSFAAMMWACKLSRGSEGWLYKIEYIPQTPDPEPTYWRDA